MKAHADVTKGSDCMAQLVERRSSNNLNQVNEAVKLWLEERV
jgi:hypothetical protein